MPNTKFDEKVGDFSIRGLLDEEPYSVFAVQSSPGPESKKQQFANVDASLMPGLFGIGARGALMSKGGISAKTIEPYLAAALPFGVAADVGYEMMNARGEGWGMNKSGPSLSLNAPLDYFAVPDAFVSYRNGIQGPRYAAGYAPSQNFTAETYYAPRQKDIGLILNFLKKF